jgi:hypothetical protein
MGLWYTASMGPTIPDQCPFCPDPAPGPNNFCCQGHNFGTLPGAGCPPGSGVGMFMRYRKAIRFKDVTDGTAHTLMIGETLPRQCAFFSVFSVNFNVSTTSIPLNTFETDENTLPSPAAGADWWKTSGFKSRHPGGAFFCLADGSVSFLSETIDYRLYNHLGTRAGGETVHLP